MVAAAMAGLHPEEAHHMHAEGVLLEATVHLMEVLEPIMGHVAHHAQRHQVWLLFRLTPWRALTSTA